MLKTTTIISGLFVPLTVLDAAYAKSRSNWFERIENCGYYAVKRGRFFVSQATR